MSAYKVGDVVKGPVNCGRCGKMAPEVVAVGFDDNGRALWACEACAKPPRVRVSTTEPMVKAPRRKGKKETKMASKATKPAATGMQTFTRNKETDNCIRVGATVSDAQTMFGSLYVRKDAWPKGAVGIRFTPEFIIE